VISLTILHLAKITLTRIIFAVFFFFFFFLVFTRNLEVDDGMDMDMEKPTNENITLKKLI